MSSDLFQTFIARQQPLRKVVVVNSILPSDQSPSLLQGVEIVSMNFDDISAEMLREVNPDCILAPLLIGTTDILDIAERLVGFAFQGLLLVVTPPIPNHQLIRAEIAALCPGLKFDLVESPLNPTGRTHEQLT